MTRSDKWMWCVWWPISAGALVGFGALGPGNHPWTGWGDALSGATAVLLALVWGVGLGLQIRVSLTDKLTKWAVDAQALCDQEIARHDETANVLFDLAHGMTSKEAAQAYLIELDRNDETDDDEPTTEPH